MRTIDNTGYEQWLVRYADGDLKAEERRRVEEWLEAHPEAAAELALYREAPHLERNEEVRYGTRRPSARPLWSMVAHWSAAAAVVAALMIPPLRMGTMSTMQPVATPSPMQADLRPSSPAHAPAPSAVRKVHAPGAQRVAPTQAAPPPPIEADIRPLPPEAAPPVVVELDTLIGYEPGPVADTVDTQDLIAFDNTASLGDRLLAAGNVVRGYLSYKHR